jgi:hypothetical protein
MPWQTHRVTSWAELSDGLRLVPAVAGGGTTYLFRGQSDADWSLRPAFARLYDQHADLAMVLHVESVILRDFLSHMPAEGASLLRNERDRNNLPVVWQAMQHFSCPTRLLDWTFSPWVAAYFAVVDRPDRDGALYSFPTSQDAGLSPSTDDPWSPYVLTDPAVASHDGLFTIVPKFHNERSAVQQGSFTMTLNPLADHLDVLERFAPPNVRGFALQKTVIAAECKHKCLGYLHNMNVTARALFPGLDGIGRAAAERAKILIFNDDLRASVLDEATRVVEAHPAEVARCRAGELALLHSFFLTKLPDALRRSVDDTVVLKCFADLIMVTS